ncbi:MAG: hypothetical protein AB7V07_07355 [Candidatus Delongbacteria bacterium]
MNTPKYLLTVIFLILAGCITTGPKKYQSSTIGKCIYDELEGNEYKLTELIKTYVTNHFFYDPERESLYQNNKNHFKALQNQNFKVLKTGCITVDDVKIKQRYFGEYRYYDEVITGELFVLDKSFSTKIITEDCTVFYFGLRGGVHSLKSDILLADGSEISDEDILDLIGNEPLKKQTLEASINYDRFEKIYKVKTPMFDDIFIRGAINEKDQQISFIQLYLNVLFIENWGFISNAIDIDGNSHEVTKISSDVNSYSFGTTLTETIGVCLDRDFLEKHKDGFELKLFGRKEEIIYIHGLMVRSFLKGLDLAIEETKKTK